MNIHHLAVQIAKREGGKKQVNIAQIKEILKVLCEIEADAEEFGGAYPSVLIASRGMKIFTKRIKKKR